MKGTLLMKKSQSNRPNYDPCRSITLLTHTGVWKFRLQKYVLEQKLPCKNQVVFDLFASVDAYLHGTWS